MNAEQFALVVLRYWNSYFSQFEVGSASPFSLFGRGPFLYPTGIVFGRHDGNHTFELIGSQVGFTPLRTWKSSAESINESLGQFTFEDFLNGTGALFELGATINFGLRGHVISSGRRVEQICSRFPQLSGTLRGRNSFTRVNEVDGPLISIGRECSGTHIVDTFLINGFNSTVRLRHVLLWAMFSETMSQVDLYKSLRRMFPQSDSEPVAIDTRASSESGDLRTATQMINRVLTPGNIEPHIGDFLRDHSAIIKRALGYSELIYEPYFVWQADTSWEGETDLNPDFLARRSDGYWDIIELKLPLLKKKRITRDSGSRLRLGSDAYTATTQLRNYDYYLSFPANAEYVKNKYDVEVCNPKKLVIIGTSENVDAEMVKTALRSIGDANIEILDYDTMIKLFLLASLQRS